MNEAQREKRTIWSWCLYDFGNSSFTTLIVTFIYATYFAKAMVPNEAEGTWLWGLGVAITAFIVAFSSPFLGAIADQGGYRKSFLLGSTLIAVFSSIMLYFPLPYEATVAQGIPEQAMRALLWFIIGNVAFELGGVFYNAFLPDIAGPEKIGRISGYGWGLGYVGGLLCMVIALIGFVQPVDPWFGFSTEYGQNIRATNILVAVWYLIFTLPIFFFIKQDEKIHKPVGEVLKSSVSQLKNTFHEVKKYTQLVRFLIARLFYNDGLVTIFAMGAIYASGTFGFETSEIIIFGIVLNITAGLGALSFGIIDDKFGGKKTIIFSLWGLSIACLMAVLAPNKTWFWIAGILVGVFAGPNQSASRSLMGRFIPPSKENEFFGFFAFSGKLTAMIGPFLFGLLTKSMDSIFEFFGTEQLFSPQRAGVAVVFILFAIGFWMIRSVDETEGMRIAKEVG